MNVLFKVYTPHSSEIRVYAIFNMWYTAVMFLLHYCSDPGFIAIYLIEIQTHGHLQFSHNLTQSTKSPNKKECH